MDNDNDLTPNGGSGFQPDTDNNPNPNQPNDPQVTVDGSQPNQPKRNVSEAKLHANRANAKKSTGPKSVRGKRHSSFNSIKHGLLARRVMFSASGKFNEDVHRVLESLREHFGCDDVVTDLLVEQLATDYWRLQEGLKFEIENANSGYAFHPQGITPNLFRYVSMNRRSFEQTLQTLMQMQENAEQEKAEDAMESNSSTNPQSEEEEAEVKALPLQTENPRSALESNSRLTDEATEQRVPECGSSSENEAANDKDPTLTGEMEEAA
jgi:hypothetical protein